MKGRLRQKTLHAYPMKSEQVATYSKVHTQTLHLLLSNLLIALAIKLSFIIQREASPISFSFSLHFLRKFQHLGFSQHIREGGADVSKAPVAKVGNQE